MSKPQAWGDKLMPLGRQSFFARLSLHPATAWAVLLSTLALTAFAWYLADRFVADNVGDRFRIESEQIRSAIDKRMAEYRMVLRGAGGLFSVPPAPERTAWRRYVESLELQRFAPGIQGLGFCQAVPAEGLAGHIDSLRAEGAPDYRVWPEGERELYCPIVYLEPFDWRNRRAFGYDMYAEPVRRQAMEQARDSAAPAVSGLVTLVQETTEDMQKGLLMYVPVYRPGWPVETVEQRRAALVGFVYSPFRAKDLIQGILGTTAKDIGLEVFDGVRPSPESRFYGQPAAEQALASFQAGLSLDVGGRIWALRTHSLPGYVSLAERSLPPAIGLGGLVVDLLLFLSLRSLSRQRDKALALAWEMTAELRQSQGQLRSILDNFPFIVWLKDTDNRYIAVNRPYADACGHAQPQDLVGKTDVDLWGEELAALWLASDLEVMRDGQAKVIEEFYATVGQGTWYEVFKAPLFDALGRLIGTTGYARDISAHKQAEAALRESEEFGHAVLDSVLSEIAVVDAEGKIVAVNEAWRRFARENADARHEDRLGVGTDYLAACKAADGDLEDGAQSAYAGIRAVLEGRLPSFCMEYPCDSPTQERWFSMSATPLGGGRRGAVVAHTDISEVHRARQALETYNDTLEAQVAARTAELEAAHAHIGLILQSTADGLYGIDGEGRFSFANPAACRLLGYAQERLIGQPAHALLHPGHADAEPFPQAECALHQKLLAGLALRFDHATYWRADGQPLSVALAGQPMRQDGKVVGAVVSFTDISERSRAEAEREAAVASLSASEERYRLLVEQTVDGIFVADAKGRFLDVNPACSAMLGYTPEEICRMGLADVVSAEVALCVATEMARLANGLIINSEWPFRRKDGSLFLGEARCRRLPDGRLQAILRDITQRKAAETALRDSQRDLERAQSLGHIGSWRLDVPRNVLTWSDENHRIFDLPKDTALSYQTFLGCIHPDDRARVDASWQAALRGEPYNIEHRIVVGGKVKWVREIAELEIAADGTLLGGFGTTQDITAQKAILAELERAKEAADAASRAKTEFLANMSHEIRTPLNAVLGLAQAGWRDSVGRGSQGTFGRILRSGHLLLNLINDILDFSKIEADKLKLEHIPFDLGEVIDQAVDMNAAAAYQKGLEFRLEESPTLPARCVGDPLRLSQVLLNLLSNAVKFTERGHVSLAVGWEDGWLACTVGDSGIGMDQAQLDRLFTAFEQADGSTTRRFGGTGLGLAICGRIVGLMGGTIGVESRPGLGSVFRLSLPLPALPAPAPDGFSPLAVLAGLVEADACALEQGLMARGVACVRLDVEAAFAQEDAALIVLPEAALSVGNPLNTQALMSAIGKRQRLLVIHTPGVDEIPASALDGRLRLDRPLRARHVLAALHKPPSAQTRQAPVPRLVGYDLLVAEDNEMNRLVLEELLRGEGARLRCVENGRLAVERVVEDGADAYALVLMDMQMPEMDGHEATRRIRAMAPDLPVVGLTAYAFAEEAERCRASGMVAHLGKPVDLDTLVAVILRHARKPRPRVVAAKPPVTEEGKPQGAVDWAALELRYQNLPGFVGKLVAMALDNHSDAPAKLRAAAAAQDYPQLVFTAHLLKGVSGNLGARGVMALAAQTEQAARADRAEALELAEALAQAMEALLNELASRIQWTPRP